MSDITWIDANNDGILDTGLIDSDHNGVYDVAYYDSNQNGVVDAIGLDLDQNGSLDVLGIDADENGVYELAVGDSNGDGVFDTAARDENQDGVVDSTLAPSAHNGGAPQPENVVEQQPASTGGARNAYEQMVQSEQYKNDPEFRAQVNKLIDTQNKMVDVWLEPSKKDD